MSSLSFRVVGAAGKGLRKERFRLGNVRVDTDSRLGKVRGVRVGISKIGVRGAATSLTLAQDARRQQTLQAYFTGKEEEQRIVDVGYLGGGGVRGRRSVEQWLWVRVSQTSWYSLLHSCRFRSCPGGDSNERGRPATAVQSTAIVAPDHRLLHEKCGLLCGRTIAIEGGQHWRKTVEARQSEWT